MSRVSRIAGAILAESCGQYFLVGNTKAPCDWAKAGFEAPPAIDALAQPFIRLTRVGPVEIAAPWLEVDAEGDPLARLLAERFLIARNGSVSDRLWRLVLQRGDAEAELGPEQAIDARWLTHLPPGVWQIVRDSILRCL